MLKMNIREILATSLFKKARGLDGLPQNFIQKPSATVAVILHKVFKNAKRLQKIPVSWIIAAKSTIFKKGDRREIENYQPVLLSILVVKIFKKSKNQSLYDRLANFSSKHQYGFVKQ